MTIYLDLSTKTEQQKELGGYFLERQEIGKKRRGHREGGYKGGSSYRKPGGVYYNQKV